MKGYRYNGKWLKRDGRAAIDENCCCCNCDDVIMPSGTNFPAKWKIDGNPAVATVPYPLWEPQGPALPYDHATWISTVGDNDKDDGESGIPEDGGRVFKFRTEFEILTETMLGCLRIWGLFSADNWLSALKVNGTSLADAGSHPTRWVDIGATTEWQFRVIDGAPRAFEIGPGLWVLGTNTLEFWVVNDSNYDIPEATGGENTSPMGLWVWFAECGQPILPEYTPD